MTRVDWMQEMYGDIKALPLRQICLPFSHDSGMSNLELSMNPGGLFVGAVTNRIMQTQKLDIGQQLSAGARFFDIRPSYATISEITPGYYASHGSYISSGTGPQVWVGGLGQSLSSICEQIGSFADNFGELIIVELSHCILSGSIVNQAEAAQPMTQGDYERLFDYIASQLSRHLYVCPDPNADLTQLPMSDFISDNKAAVVFTLSEDGITIPQSHLGNGFFYGVLDNNPDVMKSAIGAGRNSQLCYVGGYSDSDDPDFVVTDQAQKMDWYNARLSMGPPYLLEYTVTLTSVSDNITGSIEDSAMQIRPKLINDLPPKLRTDDTYPSMIGVDFFDSDVTNLVVNINHTKVKNIGDLMTYQIDAAFYGEFGGTTSTLIDMGSDKKTPYTLLVNDAAFQGMIKPGTSAPADSRVYRILVRKYFWERPTQFICVPYSVPAGQTLVIDAADINLKNMYAQMPQIIENQKTAGNLAWEVVQASYGPVDQTAWYATDKMDWQFDMPQDCKWQVLQALRDLKNGGSFVVAYNTLRMDTSGDLPVPAPGGGIPYTLDMFNNNRPYLYGLQVVLVQYSTVQTMSYNRANTSTYRTITALEGDTITLGPSCFN